MALGAGARRELIIKTPSTATKQSTDPKPTTFGMLNEQYELTPTTVAQANAMTMAAMDRANALQEKWYQQSMRYNSAEAQRNRDFQERMSNTSYQRAVEDMKKAGINPILRAQLGGRSTPGGDSRTVGAPSRNSATAQSDNLGLMGTVLVNLANALGLSSALGIKKTYNAIKDDVKNVFEDMYDYSERMSK